MLELISYHTQNNENKNNSHTTSYKSAYIFKPNINTDG